MPSGNTHMLLVKYLPENLITEEVKTSLDIGKYFLQVGAVAPDLPYASIADKDLILTNQTELADKFHYEHTNKIPIRALQHIKSIKSTFDAHELLYLFSFFAGYLSHVVADGVMHPFVLDKVGDYATNADAHRQLEMKLDTLVYHHFTLSSGMAQELNRAELYEELKNLSANPKQTQKVMQVFRDTINNVYGMYYETNKILGWTEGLHNLFQASEGKLPHIFRGINVVNSYLSPLYNEIKDQADQILTLERPKDITRQNFLKKDKIHFIEDCIPKFYATFIPLVEKAHTYVFQDGPEITESEFFEIDLDTGRSISQKNNLEVTPSFWS